MEEPSMCTTRQWGGAGLHTFFRLFDWSGPVPLDGRECWSGGILSSAECATI